MLTPVMAQLRWKLTSTALWIVDALVRCTVSVFSSVQVTLGVYSVRCHNCSVEVPKQCTVYCNAEGCELSVVMQSLPSFTFQARFGAVGGTGCGKRGLVVEVLRMCCRCCSDACDCVVSPWRPVGDVIFAAWCSMLRKCCNTCSILPQLLFGVVPSGYTLRVLLILLLLLILRNTPRYGRPAVVRRVSVFGYNGSSSRSVPC